MKYYRSLIHLLSVPYALHARTAETALQDQDQQELRINGYDLSITSGNMVTLPSGGTPSGNAGGDLSGTYPNPEIGAGAVTTAKISNAAVTADKLASNAVTTAKIANASVTPGKISGTGAVAGNMLQYNGTVWTPVAESFTRSVDDLVADKNIYAREYNRTSTGNANLVPVAYGKVRGSDGMLYTSASTSNVSVTRTGFGNYEVTISGESYTFPDYMTVASPDESTVPGIVLSGALGGRLSIRTYSLSGNNEDRGFSFVVYKK